MMMYGAYFTFNFRGFMCTLQQQKLNFSVLSALHTDGEGQVFIPKILDFLITNKFIF